MLQAYKHILNFFDKLEDSIRFQFSRHPVPYSIVAGVFVVLFWKGIEDTANMYPALSGPILIAISVPVLLVTGVFVSFFIADRVILSGLKKETRIIRETEVELREEDTLLKTVAEKVNEISKEVHKLEERLDRQK